MKKLIAVSVVLSCFSVSASAHWTTPTSYDKKQDDDIQSKYSDQWGLEDRAEIGKPKTDKVDKSVFEQDRQRQDEVIQQSHEKSDALAVRADNTEKQLGVVDQRVGKNEVRLDTAEQGIRNVQTSAEIANTRAGSLESRADATEATNDQQTQHIVTANAGIETNRQSVVNTNSRVDRNTATLGNHETRITSLEETGNRNFRELNHRIDRLDKRVDAGVSSALASAGIPQVTGEQRFALGAAVGGYESGSALAVGFSSRVTQAVVVKAAVTTDNQQGFGYNAGVSVGW